METKLAVNTNKQAWVEVIGHREQVLIEGVDVFKKFLVVEERKEGLLQMRIIHRESGEEHYLILVNQHTQLTLRTTPSTILILFATDTAL